MLVILHSFGIPGHPKTTQLWLFSFDYILDGKKDTSESFIKIGWKKELYCLKAKIPRNSTFYTSQDAPKSPNRDDVQYTIS